MKRTIIMATFAALTALGSQSPASAAMGQCFDAYGRAFGPPHSTDNPPYGMICQAYRAGGHCTHVQQSWAESNCGIAPRQRYYRGYYQSPPSGYDHDRGYQYDRRAYRQREEERRRETDPYPHRNTPGLGSCTYRDPARCNESGSR